MYLTVQVIDNWLGTLIMRALWRLLTEVWVYSVYCRRTKTKENIYKLLQFN